MNHGVQYIRQFSLISKLRALDANDSVKLSVSKMYHSYKDNKHDEFYPNAVGNLQSSIELINCTISNFLKPWAPKVKRFGFKDIDPVYIQTLEYLKETYPQSIFIFCFRNPLTQWPSVFKLDWPISRTKEVNAFLKLYNDMAKTYIEFARKHGINAFIENNDIRDESKINHIINYLNIPKIDSSLINSNIGSFENQKEELTTLEKDIIINSEAYINYFEMQKISTYFYLCINEAV